MGLLLAEPRRWATDLARLMSAIRAILMYCSILFAVLSMLLLFGHPNNAIMERISLENRIGGCLGLKPTPPRFILATQHSLTCEKSTSGTDEADCGLRRRDLARSTMVGTKLRGLQESNINDGGAPSQVQLP